MRVGHTALRSNSSLRRRAIALSNSRRLCAPAGAAPSPFLDGRKSAASTAHASMCASILVAGYPRSANCPRHRSPTCSQTVRASRRPGAAPSPFLDGRKSAASTAHASMCASIFVTGSTSKAHAEPLRVGLRPGCHASGSKPRCNRPSNPQGRPRLLLVGRLPYAPCRRLTLGRPECRLHNTTGPPASRCTMVTVAP